MVDEANDDQDSPSRDFAVALTSFVGKNARARKVLDSLTSAYLSGAELGGIVERLVEDDEISAFLYLLTIEDVDWLEKLLTDENRQIVQDMYDSYRPLLGRRMEQFFQVSWRGVYGVIDYMDTKPVYDVKRKVMVLQADYYVGDKVVHRSSQEISSMLNFARLILRSATKTLSEAGEEGLEIADEELQLILSRLSEIESAAHDGAAGLK